MTKNINVDGQDHSRNCCPFKYLLSILLRLSPVASLKTIKSHQAWISLCQRTMAVTMYYWDVQNWLTVNVVDQWCTGSYIRGRELSRHSQVNGNRCFFQLSGTFCPAAVTPSTSRRTRRTRTTAPLVFFFYFISDFGAYSQIRISTG